MATTPLSATMERTKGTTETSTSNALTDYNDDVDYEDDYLLGTGRETTTLRVDKSTFLLMRESLRKIAPFLKM